MEAFENRDFSYNFTTEFHPLIISVVKLHQESRFSNASTVEVDGRSGFHFPTVELKDAKRIMILALLVISVDKHSRGCVK